MDHYVIIENPGCTPVLLRESMSRYCSLPLLFCFDCPLGQGAELGVGRRMVWLLPAALVWKAERIGEKGEKWLRMDPLGHVLYFLHGLGDLMLPITSTKKRVPHLPFSSHCFLGGQSPSCFVPRQNGRWKSTQHFFGARSHLA